MIEVARGQLRQLQAGLLNLNKLGTKDKDLAKKTAKILAKVYAEMAEVDRVISFLVNGHAKTDEKGELISDGKNGIVMQNESIFQLKQQEVLREKIQLDVEPLDESDLDKFSKFPDIDTMAMCAPFLTL